MALTTADLQAVAAIVYPTKGTVWFVSSGGNDSSDGLSWATAKLTIQAANTAAADGDVIVASGAFIESTGVGTGRRLILAPGSSITGDGGTVLAMSASSSVEGGTITAEVGESAISIEGSNVHISRSTIYGGAGGGDGGNTIIASSANYVVVIEDCDITAPDGPIIDAETTFIKRSRLKRITTTTYDVFENGAKAFVVDCDLSSDGVGTVPSGVTFANCRGAPVTAANQVEPFKTRLANTPLIPTVAGRTLDVSATGEAGIDWANVGSPTTTLNLSNTTISTVSSGVDASSVWAYSTRTLTSGVAQVVNPWQVDALTIIKGDSYLNSDNTAITIAKQATATWPSDLESAGDYVITFTCAPTARTLIDEPSASGFSVTTGSVISASGVMIGDISHTVSNGLTIPRQNGTNAYLHTTTATRSGGGIVHTLSKGDLSVG